MRLTRRELVSAVAATAAVAQAPSPVPSSPDAELQRARDQVKANVALMSGQKVPMATEPAFQFKA